MELHTLGVDGGYTQQDVIAVARILTGWSIDRQDASFTFHAPAHDEGAKAVLGEASVPAMPRTKECACSRCWRQPRDDAPRQRGTVRAICDDVPPDGCIDDAVRAWKQSDGDIREVVRAIVLSPDFWAPTNVQSKVKTPLEFVVSAVRAVNGVRFHTAPGAAGGQLGEPLFQHPTPDGYGERQQDWVNSGALLRG